MVAARALRDAISRRRGLGGVIGVLAGGATGWLVHGRELHA
ncbi:MAG TPA: hypothetical protein VF403_00340 [Kofleriaceae bacterium]